MTVTCPSCEHEFTPGSTDEEPDGDAADPDPTGECEDCGVNIFHGEWHVACRPESEQVPDECMQVNVMGEPAPTARWCGPCSDRDISEYPDEGPVAGAA